MCTLTFRIASIAYSFRLLNHIILFSVILFSRFIKSKIPVYFLCPIIYPKAITRRIYPFSRPALGNFKAFRRLASLCASVLTGGGAIFTHAVGILAHILPSLFSATIWHSSGLASASLRILVLYLPCENVTVACCWFSKNSITFSAHLSMLKISIFSLFARISSPAPISCNIILFCAHFCAFLPTHIVLRNSFLYAFPRVLSCSKTPDPLQLLPHREPPDKSCTRA